MTNTSLLDNSDRIAAGWERRRRTESTTWAAMSAGGGRIIRTHAGDAHVLATVGTNAPRIVELLQRIDRGPTLFLHELAVAADGKPLDLPRLVRDALAGRDVSVPHCRTLQALRELNDLVAAAKPGAAAAVKDVVTASLDDFGPVLMPATIKWFRSTDDHRAWSVDMDVSVALADYDQMLLGWFVDELEELGSAGLPSSTIATLTDWDAAFDDEMSGADWDTVEVIANPRLVRQLRALCAA